MLTTCPECRTTFRVGQSHLEVRQGMVRCGNCGAVFNAYDTLLAEFETPPGEDRLATGTEEWAASESSDFDASGQPHAGPQPGFAGQTFAEESDFSALTADPAWVVEASESDSARHAEREDAGAALDGIDDAGAWPEPEVVMTIAELAEPRADARAAAVESSEEILLSELPTRRKAPSDGRIWRHLGYGLLSLGLILVFIAQLVYFLRGEIVSRQPAMRPWLEQACQALGCRIPLAQDLDQVRIESSSLETDPEQPAHARLRVYLVNRSNAEQAWPHLVLKLTDAKNAPLAQKAFAPLDYLPKEDPPAGGLRPMSEQEFRINLDLAAVEAAGYEVKLHYP